MKDFQIAKTAQECFPNATEVEIVSIEDSLVKGHMALTLKDAGIPFLLVAEFSSDARRMMLDKQASGELINHKAWVEFSATKSPELVAII